MILLVWTYKPSMGLLVGIHCPAFAGNVNPYGLNLNICLCIFADLWRVVTFGNFYWVVCSFLTFTSVLHMFSLFFDWFAVIQLR